MVLLSPSVSVERALNIVLNTVSPDRPTTPTGPLTSRPNWLRIFTSSKIRSPTAFRTLVQPAVDVLKANSWESADRLDGKSRDRARDAAAAADDLHSVSAKTRVMKEIVEHRGRTIPIELTELVADTVDEYERAYPDTSFAVDCPGSCSLAVTPDIAHALENLVENAARGRAQLRERHRPLDRHHGDRRGRQSAPIRRR